MCCWWIIVRRHWIWRRRTRRQGLGRPARSGRAERAGRDGRHRHRRVRFARHRADHRCTDALPRLSTNGLARCRIGWCAESAHAVLFRAGGRVSPARSPDSASVIFISSTGAIRGRGDVGVSSNEPPHDPDRPAKTMSMVERAWREQQYDQTYSQIPWDALSSGSQRGFPASSTHGHRSDARTAGPSGNPRLRHLSGDHEPHSVDGRYGGNARGVERGGGGSLAEEGE